MCLHCPPKPFGTLEEFDKKKDHVAGLINYSNGLSGAKYHTENKHGDLWLAFLTAQETQKPTLSLQAQLGTLKPLSAKERKRIDAALTLVVTEGKVSFRFIHSPAFRSLFQLVCPKYQIPSDIPGLIETRAKEIRGEMKTLLSDALAYSFTIDG